MNFSPASPALLVASLFLGWLTSGCAASGVLDSRSAASDEAEPTIIRRTALPLADNLLESASATSERQARSFPDKDRSEQGDNGVPSFHLVDLGGEALKSEDLIGKQAFAVVFFASWCELCARKMDIVRETLAKRDGVKLLLVSVDGPETVHHVPGFLRERRLADEQVVDGLDYPRFTQGYNPISSIPLVAVVGRSGRLVDYQVGLQHGDAPRLRTALHEALSD